MEIWHMNGKEKASGETVISVVMAGVIVALFFVTRLYRLNELPEGLHVDEAGTAYDALCLSRYGVDRYLKSWPVYFINYGGGQNALYTWICAGLFKLSGGWNVWLLRAPAVLFNFLVMIFSALLARKIYPRSRYLPLAAGAMVAICPCFILMSRFGLESYLMAGMSMAFLYAFVSAVDSGKKISYFLAGLSGGILLYTYAPSYIVLPVFLALAFLYLIWVKRFSWKGWALMAVPLAVLALPLILVQIVNLFDLPEFRLGIFTITKLPYYRASDLQGFDFERCLEVLKSIFIGDSLRYNSIPGVLNLYGITIVLSVTGLVSALFQLGASLQRRVIGLMPLVLFWFSACFLVLANMDYTNVNRVNGIFGAVVLLAVEGMWALGRMRRKALVGLLTACICAGYLWQFASFSRYYYGGGYELENNPLGYFDITVEEGIAFLEENPEYQYKGTWMAEGAVFFALSAGVSPYDMGFGAALLDDETEFDAEIRGMLDNGYGCGALGAMEEGYNYIVRNIYEDYAQELRDRGYLEKAYKNYSLFYKDWKND